jgi:heptosyltransferase-2
VHSRGIERIIIRSTNWVGDAVLTTPAVRAVRENFPEARISLLAKPWVAPVFYNNPHVDNILVYESEGRHRGWIGKSRLVRDLRRQRFHLAVLFQNAFEAALLVYLAGVPARVGYDSDCRGALLTRRIPDDRRCRGGHHVDHYLEILKGASLKPGSKALTLELSEGERDKAKEILGENRIGPGQPLIGINPGATFGSSKRWPLERYAALCDRISSTWGAQIIVLGGPGERAAGRRLSSLVKEGCTNLCGRTTLREAAAVIEKCQLFVTNDSGLMHVAAALNIPLVAIFGSTDPVATGPTNEQSRIVQAATSCGPCLKRECPEDHRCMNEISVDQVCVVVDEMMRREGKDNRETGP